MTLDSELTPIEFELSTLLKNCVDNESITLFPATEDWFSLRALMELARKAEYITPTQQIVIEDSAIYILKKLLDYVNNNILKNYKQSLKQEQKDSPIESLNLRTRRFQQHSGS
jgi:hypothetical protein